MNRMTASGGTRNLIYPNPTKCDRLSVSVMPQGRGDKENGIHTDIADSQSTSVPKDARTGRHHYGKQQRSDGQSPSGYGGLAPNDEVGYGCICADGFGCIQKETPYAVDAPIR